MRRITGLLLAALFASPSLAASGLHVSWDQCFADGRVANKAFACDMNTGSDVLVFSYDPIDERTNRSGIEAIVHIQSSSGVLPDWWMLNSGGCRAGRLTLDLTPGATTNCIDPWQGLGAGGIGAYVADGIGAGSWLLKLAMAVPLTTTWTITSGNEYFAFRLVLNHAKTVGACAGCDVPVCLAFGKARITSATAFDDLIMYAGGSGPRGGDCTVTWQGAFVNGYTSIPERASDFAQLLCLHDDSSPTHSSTWGAVKALYR